MQITVNGRSHDTTAPSVAGLLEELGLTDAPVLVEHNGVALFPRQFGTTALSSGDCLEIIQLAAGG